MFFIMHCYRRLYLHLFPYCTVNWYSAIRLSSRKCEIKLSSAQCCIFLANNITRQYNSAFIVTWLPHAFCIYNVRTTIGIINRPRHVISGDSEYSAADNRRERAKNGSVLSRRRTSHARRRLASAERVDRRDEMWRHHRRAEQPLNPRRPTAATSTPCHAPHTAWTGSLRTYGLLRGMHGVDSGSLSCERHAWRDVDACSSSSFLSMLDIRTDRSTSGDAPDKSAKRCIKPNRSNLRFADDEYHNCKAKRVTLNEKALSEF